MISFEYTTAGDGPAKAEGNSNSEAWNQHAVSVWSDTTGVGWNMGAAGTDYAIFKIETQAGSGGGKYYGGSGNKLDGIGAGGFYSNPIG